MVFTKEKNFPLLAGIILITEITLRFGEERVLVRGSQRDVVYLG
jgi:hypothetical protein